jgi:hypothetical protein
MHAPPREIEAENFSMPAARGLPAARNLLQRDLGED